MITIYEQELPPILRAVQDEFRPALKRYEDRPLPTNARLSIYEPYVRAWNNACDELGYEVARYWTLSRIGRLENVYSDFYKLRDRDGRVREWNFSARWARTGDYHNRISFFDHRAYTPPDEIDKDALPVSKEKRAEMRLAKRMRLEAATTPATNAFPFGRALAVTIRFALPDVHAAIMQRLDQCHREIYRAWFEQSHLIPEIERRYAMAPDEFDQAIAHIRQIFKDARQPDPLSPQDVVTLAIRAERNSSFAILRPTSN
jgi:hypothetical protein